MTFVQVVYKQEIPNELYEEISPLLLEPPDVGREAEEEIVLSTNPQVINAENTECSTSPNAATSINKNLAADWGTRETNYLLKKYNKYILFLGPNKKFKTKKDLWTRISRDMKNDLNLNRTGFQCENRYKTVLRRWRRDQKKQGFEEQNSRSVSSSRFSSSKKSFDNLREILVDEEKNENSSAEVMYEIDEEKKKDVAEVLWEIFKRKEENRERRHKEKMDLIKRLIDMCD